MTERDQARIKAKTVVDEATGCWIWQLRLNEGGYGRMSYNGRTELAHRASYKIHCGPIEPGLYVLHQCDTRSCVNPAHLKLGTHRDNMAEMVVRGRARGHLPTERYSALTIEQVREIRDADERVCVLARRYKVAHSTVSRIKSGKAWRMA